MADVTSQGVLSAVARKSVAGGSLLIDEDCEGTGTPSGWTDTGSVDWDEAVTVLAGSKSLKIPNSASAIYTEYSFTGGSSRYLKMLIRIDNSPGGIRDVASFRDSSGSEIARLENQNNNFKIVHGSTSSGTAAFSDDTLYYVWLEYTAGSGSDGVLDFYFATTDSKPGSADLSITTGTSTSDCARLRLGGESFANAMFYDNIQVSESAIN